AVGHEREPRRQRPQAARGLRGEVQEVRFTAGRAQVGGGVVEHGRLQVPAPGELHGGVVGHVQPLVQVHADRVGRVQAVDQGRVGGGEGGEAAEGGVHVQPEVVPL